MEFDFTWSIDKWLEVFNRLLTVIEEFFRKLGYEIFAKDTTGGSAGV